jgi:hypothetical protein
MRFSKTGIPKTVQVRCTCLNWLLVPSIEDYRTASLFDSPEKRMTWTRLSPIISAVICWWAARPCSSFRSKRQLLQSNGDYGEVMPRVVGMLITGLGIVVYRTRTEALYPVTLGVRAFFLICIVVFYAATRDPLFLTVGGIVELGFVLTGSGYFADRRSRS